MTLTHADRREGAKAKSLASKIKTASPTLRALFTEMRARKILVKDMADRIDRHANAVSNWRSGYRTPNIMDVEELAHELGFRIVLERIEKEKKNA